MPDFCGATRHRANFRAVDARRRTGTCDLQRSCSCRSNVPCGVQSSSSSVATSPAQQFAATTVQGAAKQAIVMPLASGGSDRSAHDSEDACAFGMSPPTTVDPPAKRPCRATSQVSSSNLCQYNYYYIITTMNVVMALTLLLVLVALMAR